MSGPRAAALYTTELLGLAIEVAQFPYIANAPLLGEARSRSCGSTLAMSIKPTPDGAIGQLGLRLSACAVGQAAAAIFAAGATGRTAPEVIRARDQLTAWLAGEGQVPDWPRIAMLAPALDHRGRHEAMLLPWKAALDALSKADGSG